MFTVFFIINLVCVIVCNFSYPSSYCTDSYNTSNGRSLLSMILLIFIRLFIVLIVSMHNRLYENVFKKNLPNYSLLKQKTNILCSDLIVILYISEIQMYITSNSFFVKGLSPLRLTLSNLLYYNSIFNL